jgi:8-oxo-dGTP diphosphatase
VGANAFRFRAFIVRYDVCHGAYGVTVNTGACGALDQGSIPCRHPYTMLEKFSVVLAVAAFILDSQGRILIAHKTPEQKIDGGLWTCPGGKVDPDEAIVAALRREVKEEVGLDITRYEWIGEDVFQSGGMFYHAQHFLCTVDAFNVILEDSFLGYEWLEEKNIDQYSFHPNIRRRIESVFASLKYQTEPRYTL